MAQVCNVSFAYQVENKPSSEEIEAFLDDLPLPPTASPAARLPRSRVSDSLLNMMAPSSAKVA